MGGDEAIPRTLAAELRRAPMSAGEAVRVASEVADEVAALHAAGRVHGGIRPDSVAIGDDGSAALVGPPAPKVGLAAPPARRSEDLRGVGRVLAAGLGWEDGNGLPVPVAALVTRAQASGAPAAALATALRRLEQEPFAVAALLPPAATPVAARREDSLAGLVRMIPRADRRTTGAAAAVVVGAAAVGAVLLLIGTPASTGRVPVAAAEGQASSAPATRSDDAALPDVPPGSVQAVLGSTARHELPVPAPTRRPVAHRAPAAAPLLEVATPATRPTAVPSTSPTPGTSAATTAPPTAPPTAPASTAPPTSEPTTTPAPPSSAPEPTDPQPTDPAQPSEAPSSPTTTTTVPPSTVPSPAGTPSG
jgi:hypothetical protein